MTLSSGTRLGPYEVLAPLGAGGMGEVYRARDTRLGRDVALKVLPQHLSANAEIRARFEREAKTISSLNHPHICTLFDVGRERDVDYLVMELVDGETLSARLARGALPLPEVLRVGGQIADALDRAHRAGIVHRDLKPGNVMLTKAGAKLMDFGLARATETAGPTSASGVTMATLSQARTTDSPLTQQGTLVGTFQYMAPEQLEGREADARSDLWALGCVLYEMATGRRAFDGRSQASLISAIMSSEPAPISQVAPLVPPSLDRLVRACLAKDPDDRVQTAHDVKLRLRDLAEGGGDARAAATVAPRRERLAWSVAAALGLACVALVAGVLLRRGDDRGAVQTSITAPGGTTLDPNWSNCAISPDGRLVAFTTNDSTASRSIWVQRLDAARATRLPGTAYAVSLFWSPDSRRVAYFDAIEGQLKTVVIDGGSPLALCTSRGGRGGAWSEAGDIVFSPQPVSPLFHISANGGEPVQVTWPDSARGEISDRFPTFLPDGEHFLYATSPPGRDGYEIYAGSLRSRDRRKIMTAESSVTYVEPGYLLFQRSGHVMAQRFDARALRLEGGPTALADASPGTGIDAERVATASKNGRLLFLSRTRTETHFEWCDTQGRLSGPLPLPAGTWLGPRLSPDGRFVAAKNGDDLWRIDLARGVATRLTAVDATTRTSAVWSPDGRRILFAVTRKGLDELMTVASDGSGEPEPLRTSDAPFKSPDDWCAAGIVYDEIVDGPTGRDLWLLPASGGRPVPLARDRFTAYDARVSPDGRWIAYTCDEDGANNVYVQSFPVAGPRVRVSTSGGDHASWMGGSNRVMYRSAAGATVAVRVTPRGNVVDVGEPVELHRGVLTRPVANMGMDVTRDGTRSLVILPNADAEPATLRLILNWTALLNK